MSGLHMSQTTTPTRHRDAVTAAVVDALGREVGLTTPPRRVVSLVPSLTEWLIALGVTGSLVGRTEYCVAPAAAVASIATVGGTKTPNLPAITTLAPDLVIASAEENVREHVETLIAAGLPVYVSLSATVERALAELADLAHLVQRADAAAPFLDDAATALAEVSTKAAGRAPVPYFCPIWRRPYMVAGPDTYMTDLLGRCGGVNVFGAGAARYYAVDLADVAARAPSVVLLPDEPYPFGARHVAEVVQGTGVPAERVHLVDGQSVTWYGPRIGAAVRALSSLLLEHGRAA